MSCILYPVFSFSIIMLSIIQKNVVQEVKQMKKMNEKAMRQINGGGKYRVYECKSCGWWSHWLKTCPNCGNTNIFFGFRKFYLYY